MIGYYQGFPLSSQLKTVRPSRAKVLRLIWNSHHLRSQTLVRTSALCYCNNMDWLTKQCSGVHKHASKVLIGLG